MSPAMYDQAFRELGVAGIQHRIDFDDPRARLDQESLDHGLAHVVDSIRAMGWCGGSVTHPFKEAVVPLCDELDPMAAAIGAVNTIVVRDGRVTGHNTDWFGVAESLREAGLLELHTERCGPVAVIGCGGVARAVCFALYHAGASELRLYDPVPGKANEVATALRAAFSQYEGHRTHGCRRSPTKVVVADTAARAMDGFFGVCQCSPVGMAGHPGLPFSPELLSTTDTSVSANATAGTAACTQQKKWLLECIYTPVNTELVRAASKRGLTTITGDRLNLHQFLKQFELVTGLQPRVGAAEAFFRSLLEEAAEITCAGNASGAVSSKI